MARLKDTSKDTIDTAVSAAVDSIPVIGELPTPVPVVAPAPPQPVPQPKKIKVKVEGNGWTVDLVFHDAGNAARAIADLANKPGRGQECRVVDINGEHFFTANFHIKLFD